MSTPAVAISTTLTARQPSAAKGKGGAVPVIACGRVASGVSSTMKLANAMAVPPSVKTPKAQRQESNSVINAPSTGPLKAATPQIADMTPKSCGQMARGNSRSTETKASDTSAPPPSPSIRRPARNSGMDGAMAQTRAPAA